MNRSSGMHLAARNVEGLIAVTSRAESFALRAELEKNGHLAEDGTLNEAGLAAHSAREQARTGISAQTQRSVGGVLVDHGGDTITYGSTGRR